MSDKAKPVELPEPTLLRTVMPDDWRYGHVYGYTAGQLREAIAAERKRHMAQVEALRADAERYR